jgi:hypothetical protein
VKHTVTVPIRVHWLRIRRDGGLPISTAAGSFLISWATISDSQTHGRVQYKYSVFQFQCLRQVTSTLNWSIMFRYVSYFCMPMVVSDLKLCLKLVWRTQSACDASRSSRYMHCTVAYPDRFLMHNSRFSGLLRRVVWWFETNVSEAVLLPSSGSKFMIKELRIRNLYG